MALHSFQLPSWPPHSQLCFPQESPRGRGLYLQEAEQSSLSPFSWHKLLAGLDLKVKQKGEKGQTEQVSPDNNIWKSFFNLLCLVQTKRTLRCPERQPVRSTQSLPLSLFDFNRQILHPSLNILPIVKSPARGRSKSSVSLFCPNTKSQQCSREQISLIKPKQKVLHMICIKAGYSQ